MGWPFWSSNFDAFKNRTRYPLLGPDLHHHVDAVMALPSFFYELDFHAQCNHIVRLNSFNPRRSPANSPQDANNGCDRIDFELVSQIPILEYVFAPAA